VGFQIGHDYIDIPDKFDQFDTWMCCERERAFLEAEMSVFLEDEFTEYCING